jgi:hypothetical protein
MEIEKGCQTQQTKQGMIILFVIWTKLLARQIRKQYFGRKGWPDKDEKQLHEKWEVQVLV